MKPIIFKGWGVRTVNGKWDGPVLAHWPWGIPCCTVKPQVHRINDLKVQKACYLSCDFFCCEETLWSQRPFYKKSI